VKSIGVQVSSTELQLESSQTVLDDHSVILALPLSMDTDETIHEIMKTQGTPREDYEVISPVLWQAYEQVFEVVIQNLHKIGAENIVLNHSTGAISYGYKSGLKVENMIRLVRIKTTQPLSDTMWTRLTKKED
jgi:hypothetical protein